VRSFHGRGSGRGLLRQLKSPNGLDGAVDGFEQLSILYKTDRSRLMANSGRYNTN
jgi:hypothetical protein